MVEVAMAEAVRLSATFSATSRNTPGSAMSRALRHSLRQAQAKAVSVVANVHRQHANNASEETVPFVSRWTRKQNAMPNNGNAG